MQALAQQLDPTAPAVLRVLAAEQPAWIELHPSLGRVGVTAQRTEGERGLGLEQPAVAAAEIHLPVERLGERAVQRHAACHEGARAAQLLGPLRHAVAAPDQQAALGQAAQRWLAVELAHQAGVEARRGADRHYRRSPLAQPAHALGLGERRVRVVEHAALEIHHAGEVQRRSDVDATEALALAGVELEPLYQHRARRSTTLSRG